MLSFRPLAPDEADEADEGVFELVTRAVRERRYLSFDYRKPGERRPERRRARPYHVLEFGGRWYLLAHDSARGAIRTFVLGRIREAALAGGTFERPKDFDPRRYLGTGITRLSSRWMPG